MDDMTDFWKKLETLKVKPMKVKEDFKARLLSGNIKINFNGHMGFSVEPVALNDIPGSEWTREHIMNTIMNTIMSGFVGDVDWISIEYDGVPFEPTRLDPVIMNSGHNNCGECGKRIVYEFDGENVNVVNHNREDNMICPEPGEIQTYKVSIDCPSGRMVFANDIRNLVPEADKDRYINYNSEIKKTVQDYAECGMFHIFVGNSCPSIFNNNGELTIGNQYEDDDGNIIEGIAGEDVGSVCTDLWWVCAMDEELFYVLATAKGWSKKNIDYMIDCTADVEPGVYEMTVYPRPPYTGDTEVYGTIKKK